VEESDFLRRLSRTVATIVACLDAGDSNVDGDSFVTLKLADTAGFM
jgi:hypothetical protein